MKMMSKALAAIACVGMITWSTPSYADPEVITLESGEKAPWAGTLLNPEAAAKILATGQSELQLCLVDSEKKLATQEAQFKLELSNKSAELAACTYRLTEQQSIYTQHIEYLEKRTAQPDWVKPALFTGGVLTGIAVVLVSAYALEKIE